MNMILSLFYSIVFFLSFVCSPNAFVLNECAVRNIIRKITFLIELNLMLSFNLMDKPLSLPKKQIKCAFYWIAYSYTIILVVHWPRYNVKLRLTKTRRRERERETEGVNKRTKLVQLWWCLSFLAVINRYTCNEIIQRPNIWVNTCILCFENGFNYGFGFAHCTHSFQLYNFSRKRYFIRKCAFAQFVVSVFIYHLN